MSKNHSNSDKENRRQARSNLVKFSRRQERLLEIVQDLITHYEENVLFEKLAIEIKALFECIGVTIYMLDPSGETLNPVFCDEPPNTEEILKTSLNVNNCLAGRSIRAKRGMIFNDATKQPGAYQIPGTPVEHDDHLMVIPMLDRNHQPTGVIALLRQDAQFEVNELTSGNILGIYLSTLLSNAQNYKALKKEVKAREESEQRFRTLVKFAPLGIMSTDTEGNILQVNPKLLEILGSPSAEATMAINLFDFPLLIKAGVSDDIKKVIQLGTILENEIEYTSKWGKSVYIRYVVAPNFDENHAVVGAVGSFEDITERKLAELALSVSEKRFREMANTAPVFIWTTDQNAVCNYFNKSWLEFTGRTLEQELGNGWAKGIYPEDAEKCREIYTAASERREGFSMEYRLLHFSGEYRWVFDTAVPLFDSGKNFVGYIGSCIDINDRKNSEVALRESEDKFRKAFMTSPDSVNINRLEDGMYTSINSGFTKVTGYTEEDIIGKKYPEINIWDNPEDRAQLVAALREHGEIQNLEARFVTKSGKRLYGLMSASVIELNGVPHVLNITRDITERKQIAESLLESESQLRAILESSWEGILAVDNEGRVIKANSTFFDMWGIPKSVVSTLKVNVLVDAVKHQVENPEVATATINEISKSELPSNGILLFKDGRRFERFSAPLFSKGRLVGRLWTFLDITEKYQAEETKARLEAQLQQSQKMESVGRLAGGVAHDFNNMLSVILGHTEIALEKLEANHPLHSSLQEIYKAGERSAEITRQLLAFARKQVIQPQMLDLDKTVENMLSLRRRLIGEDIELYWHPSHEPKSVKMDPSQVDQIMANLVVNARDAIGGIGKLTIETGIVTFDQEYCDAHAEARPGEFVMLAISDDGIGMDKELLGKIFEPFFTTKGLGQGTGLGLATVFGIVKQNEGFLNVYSELGEGTTFKIYLPCQTSEPPRELGRFKESISKGNHELILVVEDEVAIMEMSKETLETLGYNVLGAITPNQALELAYQNAGEIKLLLTDVVMPEMNGRELASQIQEIIPNIKILFMSGYTTDVISHRGILEADMNFIQKPFARKELAAQLRTILNQD